MSKETPSPTLTDKITFSVEGALQLLDGYTRVRLYSLLNNREIESYKDGRRRIIVGESLRQYVARRAKEAASGP